MVQLSWRHANVISKKWAVFSTCFHRIGQRLCDLSHGEGTEFNEGKCPGYRHFADTKRTSIRTKESHWQGQSVENIGRKRGRRVMQLQDRPQQRTVVTLNTNQLCGAVAPAGGVRSIVNRWPPLFLPSFFLYHVLTLIPLINCKRWDFSIFQTI